MNLPSGFSFLLMLDALLLSRCSDSGIQPSPLPDTTSHNFYWTLEYPGDSPSGSLRDICIVNDSLAYAVGDIYLRDSLGNWDLQAYNLAIWNGRSWRLERIQFYTICGQESRSPYSASSVLAFGPNDIWIAMEGDEIARWDGTKQTATMCLPVSFSVAKLWGESPTSVYAVGDGGNIMHCNGSTWQRLESGTTLPIRDIYGARHPTTGQLTILAVASGYSPSEGKKLLSIQGTRVTALPDSGLAWYLTALWFAPSVQYYVVGAGIHHKSDLAQAVWDVYPSSEVTNYASTDIRGNGFNDFLVVGSGFEIVHFNGATWRNYRGQIPISNNAFGGVAMKGNLAMAVGSEGQRAVVAVGRR